MSDNLPVLKYANYVVCPYDKMHQLLPHRVASHLERCKRNYPNRTMVNCPFNSTHVLDPKETDIVEHLQTCRARIAYEMFQASPTKPRAVPPASKEVLVSSAEDWDAEPHASTYDPMHYCLANNIVRPQYGQTAAKRRIFREEERKRLIPHRQNKPQEADNKSAAPLHSAADKDKGH